MESLSTWVLRFKRPHSKYGRIRIVNVPKEVTIESIKSEFPEFTLISYAPVSYLRSLTDSRYQSQKFFEECPDKAFNKEAESEYLTEKRMELIELLNHFSCKELNDMFKSFLAGMKIPEKVTDCESVTFKLDHNGKLRKVK